VWYRDAGLCTVGRLVVCAARANAEKWALITAHALANDVYMFSIAGFVDTNVTAPYLTMTGIPIYRQVGGALRRARKQPHEGQGEALPRLRVREISCCLVLSVLRVWLDVNACVYIAGELGNRLLCKFAVVPCLCCDYSCYTIRVQW
jgi:hypothetical protein